MNHSLDLVNTNEIPPIPLIPGTDFCLDARMLYDRLKPKTKYSQWIRYRIEQGNGKLSFDYVNNIFSELSEKASKGRPRLDFYVTLNFGKHIALLEDTSLGRAIRQRLIDIEKDSINDKMQVQLLEARIQELENLIANMPTRMLPKKRAGQLPVPVMSTDMFGYDHPIKYEMKTKEEVGIIPYLMGKQRHVTKVSEGAAKTVVKVTEELNDEILKVASAVTKPFLK